MPEPDNGQFRRKVDGAPRDSGDWRGGATALSVWPGPIG